MENRGTLRFLVETLSGQPHERRQDTEPRYATCDQPRRYSTVPGSTRSGTRRPSVATRVVVIPLDGSWHQATSRAFWPRHRNLNSSQVSNLAQTRKPTPVILYSAECVERATTADSQLSFLGRGGSGLNQFTRSDHIQPIGIRHPCVCRGTSRRLDSTPKSSRT